jgi:ankyrin repeat protein
MDNPRIIKDSYNNSILHYTCINKNFVLFKVLIDYILDGNMLTELIDSKNQNDESIFSIACKNGCLEIVEYLLKLRKLKKVFNYDPLNCRDDEYSTPLHSAAKTNHLRILELLIENGANVNAKGEYKYTALLYASEKGHSEIV